MNDFIGGNYGQVTEEQQKAKKMMKIIGAILVLLVLISIVLIVAMYYIESTELKVSLNGKENSKLKNILLIENGEVYVPIRAFAQYVGYTSSNGAYKQYSEDTTQCYVECANEVATFSLNSNKIYKVLLDGNNDYEYYEIEEPVKMIDGQLYTTIEGARIAFNVSMTYSKNKITVYTLPNLVQSYTAKFKNAAISEGDGVFSNQKALLYNMIIVKDEKNYGVYTLDGKEVLGIKYASIKFIESTKEFIVTTQERKMGIMSYDSTTKINPEYDSIKQIDKDNNLYLVTNSNKQGVINGNGSIVIYLDYDQIGIDITKYAGNNIQNQYLLYENCIPVKRNNMWGLFDKTGKEIVPVKYQELGCSVGGSTSGVQNANSVLLIPDYEGIVVKENNFYGVIDSSGKNLVPIVLKSIYSTTTAGETTYSMIYEEQIMNVLDYIEKYSLNSSNTNNNSNNSNTNSNTQNENTVNETSNNNEVNTQNTNAVNETTNNNGGNTQNVNAVNDTANNNEGNTQNSNAVNDNATDGNTVIESSNTLNGEPTNSNTTAQPMVQ